MQPPEVVSSESIYESKYTNLVLDKILINGQEHKREIVVRPEAVVIIPFHQHRGTVFMVKQWRHAAQEFLLEFPAGKVEEGMTVEETAHKELEEEIKFAAGHIAKVGEIYASPGYSTEKLTIFSATNLVPKDRKGDDDEEIEIVEITWAVLKTYIETGQVKDGKTLSAFLLYNLRKIV